MKNFIKRVNSLILAAVVLFTAVFSGIAVPEAEQAMAATVSAEKPADGSTVYLYNTGRVRYGGYSTHYYETADSSAKNFTWAAYCADPEGGVPAAGYYEIDYDITSYMSDNTMSGKSEDYIERIVYYLYGQPGYTTTDVFQNVIVSTFGSTDWNGDPWVNSDNTYNDDSFYVVSHLVVAYMFGALDEVLAGTSESFQAYFTGLFSYAGMDGLNAAMYAICMRLAVYTVDTSTGFDVYVVKTQDVDSSAQMILGTYFTDAVEEYGCIKISKTSSISKITSGNGCYSLKDATYGIYSSQSCSSASLVDTVTLSAKGTGKSGEIALGTYYIKEIDAPEGYELSTDTVTVTVEDTESVTLVSISDTPAYSTMAINIAKVDSELGTTAQGDASLAGARFTIRYYDEYVDDEEDLPLKATKKWIIETDSDGNVTLDSAHIATDVTSSALYTVNGEVVLPLGTYTITESTAPTGYNKDDATFTVGKTTTTENFLMFQVTQESSGGDAKVSIKVNGIEADNTTDEGLVTVTKVDGDTLEAVAEGEGDLSGAVFTISNASTNPVVVNGKTYAKGDPITTIKTNSSGVATLSSGTLPYGTYTIQETTAPEGYIIDAKVYTFTIREDGQVATLEIPNDIERGKGKVIKTDADSGESEAQGDADLSGAEFTVYNASTNAVVVNGKSYAKGEAILTMTTTSDGTATSGSDDILPYGKYSVKETYAPEGYTKSDETYYFTITEDGQTASVTVEDAIMRGGVTITKVDADTLKAEAQGDGDLSGAEFTIYNNGDSYVLVDTDGDGKLEKYAKGAAIMTLTTDSDGVAKTSAADVLPYGSYYAKETKAPEGYLLDTDTVYEFKITADGQMATATADDDVQRGGFTVTKADADTQVAQAQGDGVLSGAKFTVYNVSSKAVVINGKSYATGTKSSNNGTATISGKTYYLGDAVLTTLATGTDGKVTVDTSTLPYGTYVIKETTAPAGYILSEDAYVFTIRSDGELKNVTIDNEIIRGGVEIYKRDTETLLAEAQGDATLAGATFEIVNASSNSVVVNGVAYASGAVVLTLTTDDTGYATTDTDGDGVDHTLPYGTYTIRETASPTGYLKEGTTERTFTIRENGVVVDMTDASKSILDDVIRGGVEIYKYCDELASYYGDDSLSVSSKQGDTTLEGAEFTIYNKSGSYVMVDTDGDGTLEKYASGEAIMTIVTDASGYASTYADTLPYGTYLIKETKAPTGFLNSGTIERTFTIREDGVIVDMTSSSDSIRNTPIRGGLTIYKMDENLVDLTGADDAQSVAQGDATLAGAVYAIRNASSKAVLVGGVLYEPGEVVMYITTDSDGMATTDTDGDGVDYTLPYGTYDIYETGATDYGYLLNEDDVNTVRIRENGVVEVLDGGEVTDEVERQAFQIVKVSADTEATEVYGVEGAQFTIYNVSDSVVTLGDGVYRTGTADSNNGTSTVNGTTYYLGDAVETITTDSTGYACSSRLAYGTYVVRETYTPVDLNTVKDFVVTIRKDSTEPQVWRYFNDSPFQAYVKAVKEDSKTGKTVLIEGVTFKILNVDTNEYVTQKVGDQYIDTFYTNSDGYVMTPLKLDCGNYRLVEITAPYGYTVLEDGVDFTVTNQTMYLVDQDNDPVITVTCVNDEVTGTVTVYKHGEALTGITTDEDGNIDFVYEDRPLAGTTFAIVADEDIYTPDMQTDGEGNRTIATYNGIGCYEGATVATIISGTDGYAVAEGLPLGSYHIEEIGVTPGYTLNTDEDSFTLTYKDQDTAVIYYGESDYRNERVTTELTLTKTGLKSGEPIEGAVYGLYAAEDIISYSGEVLVEEGTLIETRTTDADGAISWTADLPLYNYYVKETEAAAGTLLNDEVYYVDLSYQGAEVPVVAGAASAVNDETELDIIKLDTETGEALEGAVLQLLDEAGNVIDEWTTDGTPHKVYRLEEGYYTVHEVSAPAGYATFSDVTIKVFLMSEIQEIRVSDEQTELHVSKVEAAGGEELPGATLQIIDGEGSVLYEWTSTEEAYVIKKIPVGTYTLHEDYTPLGYATAQDIEFTVLDTGDVQGVTMVDEIITVSLSKADATTGEELPGAELTLSDSEGSVIDEWVSTYEPHVITGLLVGTAYTLHESLAPLGYATAQDVTFTVEDTGEVQKVVMEDEIITVSLSKADATTGEELPGALLTLCDSEGSAIYEWTSTDEPYVITGLPVGATYILHEDYAPLGYATAQDVTFTVSDTGEVQEVVMEDEIITVSVSKADAATGGELPGAELTVYDMEGNVIDSWTSTDEPHIITGLHVGDAYILHESLAPLGYATASDVTFVIEDTGEVQKVVMEDEIITVSLSKADATTGGELPGAELTVYDAEGSVIDSWTSTDEKHVITGLYVGETYTLHESLAPLGYATASDVTFVIEDAAGVQEVVMEDEIITVSISKLDVTSGDELPGAELVLYDSEGNAVEEWTSTSEPHVINGLHVGETYTLHESLAPLGYATASDVTFTIADTGEIQEVVMEDELTTVSISKADATTGEELPGAELVLYDSEGNVVDEWTSTDESHDITGLHVGETYTLHESLAPLGYATASDVTFTVEDTRDVQEVVMEDEITTVSVSKVDATDGKELPGAELQVLDSEGNVVEEWTSTDEPHVITGLHVGETYTLHESLAPLGYATASDVKFVIEDTGGVQEVVMEDMITTVEITKADITTGEEIPGAILTVTDEDGNVIDTWTSTDTAHIITGLHVGKTYTLHEDCAPAGYDSASDITFTIEDTGDVQRVVMYDEPTPVITTTSPKTADMAEAGLALMTALFGAGSACAGLRRRKEDGRTE